MTNHFSTKEEIDVVMHAASEAFRTYHSAKPSQKAQLLEAIAKEMDDLGDTLIFKASEETNLSPSWLLSERARTTMQLRAFASMLQEGSWVEASIDTAVPDRTPRPKPDLRKMLVPIGPVVVFGASNFPFAYSTAGGDTASALAAGCPVIVKAHPAHAETSAIVYEAIQRAVQQCNLPAAVVQHVFGDNETGKALVQHTVTAAVGFTGSFGGGNALLNYARDRKNPILVFCEMGSVNPVLLLPDALQQNTAGIASMYASSITQNMGQFCTNPGVLLAVDSEALNRFIQMLSDEVGKVQPASMLHEGIYRSYMERMNSSLAQPGVTHQQAAAKPGQLKPLPTIAVVEASVFLENHLLQEEVFGPYSIVVQCRNMEELKAAWLVLDGQLTTSLMGTEKDFEDYKELISLACGMAGRVIFNGVPTGVEVCPSMVHGGLYPATTDSRFTAVGLSAVKRWVRPVCYQNCPDHLLPDELQNANPLHLLRFVNSGWTREAVQ